MKKSKPGAAQKQSEKAHAERKRRLAEQKAASEALAAQILEKASRKKGSAWL